MDPRRPNQSTTSILYAVSQLKTDRGKRITGSLSGDISEDIRTVEFMCQQLWKTHGKRVKKQLRDNLMHGNMDIQAIVFQHPDIINTHLVETSNGIYEILCFFSEKFFQEQGGQIPHPTTYWKQSWKNTPKYIPWCFHPRYMRRRGERRGAF